MKFQILFSVLIVLLFLQIPNSFSELDLSTNSKVYSPAHNLQVYGTGLPEENLIIRLFAPDETIAKFDQLTTDSDGSFNYSLLTWPAPSTNFPYGTYTVEIISTEQNGLSKKIDVKFSSTTELLDVTVERYLVHLRPYTKDCILLIILQEKRALMSFMLLPLVKEQHLTAQLQLMF